MQVVKNITPLTVANMIVFVGSLYAGDSAKASAAPSPTVTMRID